MNKQIRNFIMRIVVADLSGFQSYIIQIIKQIQTFNMNENNKIKQTLTTNLSTIIRQSKEYEM